MKLFNAIQLVIILVLGPILIPLLKTCTFFGATAAMYVLSVGWVVLLVWVIAMVYMYMDDQK